ncbi:MAG: hypothetical protein ACAH59_01685 [Pseudobdellovibrionaceae bacterium]
MKAGLALLLSSFLGLNSALASPVDACDRNGIPGPVSLLDKSETVQKILTAELLPTPFQYACPKGARQEEIPKGLQTTIPRYDLQGNDGHRLLSHLAQSLNSKLEKNKDLNQYMLGCIDPSSGTVTCAQEVIKGIKEVNSAARQHRAYSQALDPDAPLKAGSISLPDHTFKFQKWENYSTKEMENAKTFANLIKQEVQKKIPKGNSDKNLMAKSMTIIQSHENSEYKTLMENYRILQFLSSENPTAKEIRHSFLRMEANRQMQESKSKNFEADLNPKAKEIDTDPLWILLADPVETEKFLIQNPQYCTLATAMLQQLTNQKEKMKQWVSIGLIAGTFVAPHLVGGAYVFLRAGAGAAAAQTAATATRLGANSAVSLYWAKDPLAHYMDMKRSVALGPLGEDATQTLESVSTAKEKFDDALYFQLPSSLVVGGALGATQNIASQAFFKVVSQLGKARAPAAATFRGN